MSVRQSAFIDIRPLTTSPAFARLWVGSTLAGLGLLDPLTQQHQVTEAVDQQRLGGFAVAAGTAGFLVIAFQ